MGFFKKIGQGIKRATKQISFHNAVKLASVAVPGIGGSIIAQLQEAHDAKKAQNEAEAQQALDNAAANTNTLVQDFGTKVVSGLPSTTKNVLANAGSDVADATIKVWFKKHWKAVTGIAVGVLAVIFTVVKLGHRKHSTKKRFA